MLGHLTGTGAIPPFPALQAYAPPERDVAMLQGWSGDRNKDLPGPGDRKRKATEAQEEGESGQSSARDLEPLPAPQQWPVEPPPRQFWDRNLSLDNHVPDHFAPPLVSPIPRSDSRSEPLRTPDRRATGYPPSIPNSSPSIGQGRTEPPPLPSASTDAWVANEEVLGSADARPDVIAKGIVSAADAAILVN
jgi:hypothetical protein